MEKQRTRRKVVNRKNSRLTPEMRKKMEILRVAMAEKDLTYHGMAEELNIKYGTLQHAILRFLTRQTFSLQGKYNTIIFLFLKRHEIDLREIFARK